MRGGRGGGESDEGGESEGKARRLSPRRGYMQGPVAGLSKWEKIGQKAGGTIECRVYCSSMNSGQTGRASWTLGGKATERENAPCAKGGEPAHNKWQYGSDWSARCLLHTPAVCGSEPGALLALLQGYKFFEPPCKGTQGATSSILTRSMRIGETQVLPRCSRIWIPSAKLCSATLIL